MTAKRGLRFIALLLTLSLALLGGTSIALAALEAEVVKSVNMREGAGADEKTITKLKKGAVVTVLDRSNEEWWHVSYKEQEGYISSEFLKLKLPPPEPGYVTRHTQLRATPEIRGEMRSAIPANAVISILDSSDKTWWWVLYDDQEGYIQAVAIKKGTPPNANIAPTSNENSVNPNDPNADRIAKAKRINADTVGWIDVPNTNVSDPILYGPNFYYSNRNIYKKKSLEGVYPYVNRLTRNVVIFGHNLRNSNSGMHQLHHLQEAANGRSSCQYGKCGRSISSVKDWYKSDKGRIWNISIFGKTQWEVFAMYEVPRNEPIATLRSNWNTSASTQQSWIDKQLARSEVDFGVSVSSSDQVMTIITCGTNYDSASANSRLFFFLKCVG